MLYLKACVIYYRNCYTQQPYPLLSWQCESTSCEIIFFYKPRYDEEQQHISYRDSMLAAAALHIFPFDDCVCV